MALFMALFLLLIEHIVAVAAAWVLALADEAVGFMLRLCLADALILDFVVVGEAAKIKHSKTNASFRHHTLDQREGEREGEESAARCSCHVG